MSPKILRSFVACAIPAIALFLVGQALPGRAEAASPPHVLPATCNAFLAKAGDGGTARVIVGLQTARTFIPEGDLPTDHQVQVQRGAIRVAQAALLNSLAAHSVTVHTAYRSIPFVALEVDEAALQALIASPLVASIEEDVAVPPTLASSTPLIGADNVWEAGEDGSGVAVAILDTGVQYDHSFFGSRVVAEACFSTNDPGAGQYTLCPNGQISQTTGHAADPTTTNCMSGTTRLCDHGTHVAGIAAGDGTSYDGVAPGADVIAIQVFTRFTDTADCGVGDAPCVLTWSSDQVSALEYIYTTLRLSHTVASVNMSLGGGYYTSEAACDLANPSRKAAIDNLRSAGIPTIISSGNDGYTDGIGAPGCISTAVAVGATDDSDAVASFSNSSDMVDLLAPGVAIDSSVPENGWDSKQGTSMAAPHVAGAWALVRAISSTATVDDILTAFQTTGVNVTDSRNSVTKPRIQVDAAAAEFNPVTWVGNTSAWDVNTNWSPQSVPTRIANVTIPGAPTGGHFPTVNADGYTLDLTIQTGAEVTMTANTLYVSGDWLEQGTGVFNGMGGSVVFRGDTDQRIGVTGGASDHFYNVQIGDGSTTQVVSTTSDLDVDGNLTIAPGASLAGGSHTINVAGDWDDNGAPNGFVCGLSTVDFDGGGQSAQKTREGIAFSQDFSAWDGGSDGLFYFTAPPGWAVTNEGAANSLPWLVGYSSANPNSPDTGGHARHLWHPSYPGLFDTWLFTPGLDLDSYSTYRLEFQYGARNASYAENLQVMIGSGQTSTAMTTELFTSTGIVNTSWSTAVVTFAVSSDGEYNVGFRTWGNPATTWDLALDDIALTRISDIVFYNLTTSSGGGGLGFGGDVIVKNDLTVNAGGAIDVSDITLTVDGALTNNGTISETSSVTAVGTGVGFAHVTDRAGGVDKYLGVVMTPTSSSVGSVEVGIRGNQECTTADAGDTVNRCFRIVPGSGNPATIRFYYLDSELDGFSASTVRAWHWEGLGPRWEPAGSSWTQYDGAPYNYCEATGVATYSVFSLAGTSEPTAVTLDALAVGSRAVAVLVALLLALLALGGVVYLRSLRRRS